MSRAWGLGESKMEWYFCGRAMWLKYRRSRFRVKVGSEADIMISEILVVFS